MTAKKIEEFSMDWPKGTQFLRYLSLAAPVAGLATMGILLVHIGLDFKHMVDINKASGHGYIAAHPLNPRLRYEMVFLIVAVPGIFTIMAMRSLSREWSIMRCFDRGAAAATDSALFDENLELSMVCQYYVVLVFAFLCIEILKDQGSHSAEM